MLHIKLIIPIFVEKEVSYVEYRIYFFWDWVLDKGWSFFLSERESILQPTYYKKEGKKSLKKVKKIVAY